MLEFINPENYFPVAGLVGKTLKFYSPINSYQSSAKIHYYEQYKMFTIEYDNILLEFAYFGLEILALPLIDNPTGAAMRYKFRYYDNSELRYSGTS